MDSASKKRIVEYIQLLQKGRTMIARFRLPVNEDKAYELLLAAVIAEVQFRHRKFVYNEFIDDQLRQIAKWLTAGSSKLEWCFAVDAVMAKPPCSKLCETL